MLVINLSVFSSDQHTAHTQKKIPESLGLFSLLTCLECQGIVACANSMERVILCFTLFLASLLFIFKVSRNAMFVQLASAVLASHLPLSVSFLPC